MFFINSRFRVLSVLHKIVKTYFGLRYNDKNHIDMCYNTILSTPQNFMIFEVLKVFILHFTKSPKNCACLCFLHSGRQHCRPHGRP